MKRTSLIFALLLTSAVILAQDVPEATELYVDLEKVTPGEGNQPPSDAVVLFDGSDLSNWQKPQAGLGGSMKDISKIIPEMDPEWTGEAAEWQVEDGVLVVGPGTGDIITKQAFGDVQLHIEWMAPVDEGKSGQLYSNSGVFFMGLYEVQVLNSYENPTYNNGQAGSIYKQIIP